MPPGLLPEHKASVVLFLERVYGISDAGTFMRLLENGFLPDLRAATLLDSVRYSHICNSLYSSPQALITPPTNLTK